MITHRGIWAIAHTLSCKHSYIPGTYHCKHLLIPCPTNSVVGHILRRVSNKRVALPLTKARIGLERQRQTCAVWAKRTEYSIEQIRQSLQRLKITKIVRLRNLHNFRTIGSVFFRHTFAIQVVNHWPVPIANSLRSGTCHAACSRARVHDIWATIHMSSQQLAATDCFHCVNKVSYSQHVVPQTRVDICPLGCSAFNTSKV